MVFGKPVIFVIDRNGTSHESNCKHAGIVLHPDLPQLEQGRRTQDELPTHLLDARAASQGWTGPRTHSPVPTSMAPWMLLQADVAWGRDIQYCAFMARILLPSAGVTLRATQVGSDIWVGDPDPFWGPPSPSPHSSAENLA